jgi:predicted metalloprotease
MHVAAMTVLASAMLVVNSNPSRAAESKGDCYVLLAGESGDNWQGPTSANISQCAALAGEQSANAEDGIGKSRWQDVEIQASKDGSYQAFKSGQLQSSGFWDLARLMEVAVDDIDGFWQREFVVRGWEYTSPNRVEGYTRRIRTACGRSVPNNAFFCRESNSIYYDTRLLQSEFNDIGNFAPTVIVAHEWGHSIQLQRGIFRSVRSTLRLEQQADCFAGAYVRDADARGVLSEGDVQEALDLFGDMPGRSQTHGTRRQRIAAFQKGLDGGVDACLK